MVHTQKKVINCGGQPKTSSSYLIFSNLQGWNSSNDP